MPGPSRFHPKPEVEDWDHTKLDEYYDSDKGDSSDEDQIPKSSHIFDHSGPWPSPSKLDPPPFLKNDEDENIRIEKYHASSEDSKGQLSDEDNPVRSAAFLDFALQQFQKAGSCVPLAQPSPFNTSIVACGSSGDDPSSDSSKRNNCVRGTRKGIRPEALLPLDAPTQPRKYAGPSAASPKNLSSVSTVLAGKRPRAEALEEEEDEDEPLAPNTTEREQIEWKRRGNVLAARRSRKRKLEYQGELEESVANLTLEKDEWQARALTLRQILQSHGIPFNEFQD